MTIEEIRKNAPEGATHYLITNNFMQYLMLDNGVWRVAFNYDVGNGWGLASNQALTHLKNKAKPLY